MIAFFPLPLRIASIVNVPTASCAPTDRSPSALILVSSLDPPVTYHCTWSAESPVTSARNWICSPRYTALGTEIIRINGSLISDDEISTYALEAPFSISAAETSVSWLSESPSWIFSPSAIRTVAAPRFLAPLPITGAFFPTAVI